MEISSAVPAEIAERMNDKPRYPWRVIADANALQNALTELVDDLMTFGQYPWNATGKSNRKADLAEWIADGISDGRFDFMEIGMWLTAHIKGDVEAAEDADNRLRAMLMDHYRDSELVQWIVREE